MQREQKCRDAQDAAKDIFNSASSFLEDVIITINFNHFQFDAYVIQYLEAQRQNQPLPERPGIFLLILFYYQCWIHQLQDKINKHVNAFVGMKMEI